MALLILIALILFIIGMFYASYQTANYYLVNYILNGKIWQIFSKEFFIVVAPFFIIAFLLMYFNLRGPNYINQGIDQLHENQFVKKEIGGFSSYSYNQNNLPQKPISNVVFQIALNAKDTLFLTCTMKKIGDNWKLIKIQQDSVHKGHD